MTYRLRKQTNAYELTLFLFHKGSCYKQDLLMYAYKLSKHNQTNSSKLVRTLHKNNIIYFQDFNLKTKTVSVAFLTEQGRKQIIKLADIQNIKHYDNLLSKFNSRVYKKLLYLYNQNHIATMFDCVNIPTDTSNKPTLLEIYNHINHIQTDNFLSTPPAQLQEYLDKGIYYSKDEYKDFFKLIEHNEELIVNSIFKGIFISTDKCIVIYSNGKDNKKMIRLARQSQEFALTEYLIKQRLAPLRIHKQKRIGLYALTMSDANSFIYSSAVGRKRGEIKRRQLNEKSFVLTPDSNINYQNNESAYCGMYSVIYNKTGINCLLRLVSNTTDTTYTYPKSLAGSFPYLFSDNPDEYDYPVNYNHKGKWLPCCYIPVYELLFLNEIKNSSFTPAIITDKDMASTISRITHKDHVFLDIDSLRPIQEDATLIYDDKGYNKGKKMLQDYFLSLNQSVDAKQYKEIPAKYNMSYNAFYNALALGQLSIQDVVQDLNPSSFNKTHIYKTKKSTLVIPNDIYLKIKQLAKENHHTIQYTATKLLEIGLNNKSTLE